MADCPRFNNVIARIYSGIYLPSLFTCTYSTDMNTTHPQSLTLMLKKPALLLNRLEQGDTDTSASTLRTLAAVFLVVTVVGLIVAATTLAGTNAANTVSGATW
jgi:hypothetical protein